MSSALFDPSLSSPLLLQIETLGRLSLRWGDREIALPNRKAKALIGYLALSEVGIETRERLVGLFWSEKDHKNARDSLRQVVRSIRKAFAAVNCTGFVADNDALSLDRSKIDVDILGVLSAADQCAPHNLLGRPRLTDSLLDQMESVDPAFNVWLQAKRQTIRNRLTAALEDALRGDELACELREKTARSLLNLDETHEEAARIFMRCRVRAGDMGGALRAYKELWTLLEDEYGVEPSQETQDLVVQLKLSQPLSDQLAHPAGSIPSTVVHGDVLRADQIALDGTALSRRPLSKLAISMAPFDMLGVGQSSRHVVHGFRKELIASLVRFREWGLRDMMVSDTVAAVPQAGEYVIEGSAMADSECIRFVLMLRDLANNEYLWSERVDVSLENWIQAQQLIVRRITTVLNVHLSAGRVATITNHGVTDWKAFDLWLLGQATLLTYDQKKWDTAAGLFQQVIDEMPDFAPAYSSLAQLSNGRHIAMPGVFRNAELTERALTFARRAAHLDPIDSRSQLCLGWSHAMSKQYEHAMVYMPLAYELNDNDPWTMISSANCMAFCGQYDQANEIAQHALGLPMAPSGLQWSYHVAIRFMCSDYEGCVQAADLVEGTNPNVPGYKAAALFHLGRVEESQEALAFFFDAVRKRWINEAPASDEAITRWFLTMFPIANPGDWERLRLGLEGAGAPAIGLKHHQW